MSSWREPPPIPGELFHYMQITIDKELLRLAGEQMPNTDPLDRPLTVRDLINARETLGRNVPLNTRRLVEQLEKNAKTAPRTDFVRVSFGTGLGRLYTYRVANQPTRRVRVGDLVTVRPNEISSQPQIVRVVEVDVPEPKVSNVSCVAISPEDAERIEAVIGKVR